MQKSQYKFCLYIAGNAANSNQAYANLVALCRAELPNRHHIEIVDVLKQPERALKDRIFMTPTLVKLDPMPVQYIIGKLSEKQLIMQLLEIQCSEPRPELTLAESPTSRSLTL